MSDWTNISPSNPPKYKTSKNDNRPIMKKVGVDGIVEETAMGPKEVFPRGTNVGEPVELGARVEEAQAGILGYDGQTIDLPEEAEVVNRANHVFQGTNYEVLEVRKNGSWYGFLVDSGLGMTLHQVPIATDRDLLIRQHLKNPGIQQHYKELGAKMPLVTSKKIEILNTHGVADASQIEEILHPKSLTLMESLIQQKAFIVTNDAKIIDIAAHTWPIDLEKAVDVRATVGALVKLGSEVGEVAQAFGEKVEFLFPGGTKRVAVQDLQPIMKEAAVGRFYLLIKSFPGTEGIDSLTGAKNFAYGKGFDNLEGGPSTHGETGVYGDGEYSVAAAWLAESQEPPFKPGDLLWFKELEGEAPVEISASIIKKAAENTWVIHRVSDAGEERDWMQFPTEQAMSEYANSKSWNWQSKPDMLFKGYWVDPDGSGTSYMPDIKPQTGEVYNPQGLTGGQKPPKPLENNPFKKENV